MKVRVAIADYGCGNIQSVVNALNVVGADTLVASNAEQLSKGDKIILPGVGAFREAMEHLQAGSFIEALEEEGLRKGKPILGICLGMQLMCRCSDEGTNDDEADIQGLAWIDADVKHFNNLGLTGLKVPHMGWNELQLQRAHYLTAHIEDNADVYFVHSHAVQCDSAENVLSYSEYGVQFVSSLVKNNIMGMQFHPEKSHKVGLQILENFVGAKF